MTAASIRPTQTTQASLPPAGKAGEKDKRSICITQIALPIITALVSFLLLPVKMAMAFTAGVTLGVIVYIMRTNNKSPQVPSSVSIKPGALAVQSKSEPTSLQCPVEITAKRIYNNKYYHVGVEFQNVTAEKQFRQTFEAQFPEFLAALDQFCVNRTWISPLTPDCYLSTENKNAVILAHLEKLFGKATIDSLVKNRRHRLLGGNCESEIDPMLRRKWQSADRGLMK